MNALALLSTNYDSDDEEVVIEKPSLAQSSKKLPLPESIRNLNISNELDEVINDSAQHNGRIRTFAHERGNWATCVYIPYKDENNLRMFCDNLIETCKPICEFQECDDLHISLSRTVALRHHWIDLFVEDVKNRLKSVENFFLDFDNLAVYCNDEKTRTFLGVKVRFGFCQLMECVNYVNATMLEFKLPTFYEDPSFHMSLIWCVGHKEDELKNILPKLQAQFDRFRTGLSLAPKKIDKVVCKIGNRFYKFPLS